MGDVIEVKSDFSAECQMARIDLDCEGAVEIKNLFAGGNGTVRLSKVKEAFFEVMKDVEYNRDEGCLEKGSRKFLDKMTELFILWKDEEEFLVMLNEEDEEIVFVPAEKRGNEYYMKRIEKRMDFLLRDTKGADFDIDFKGRRRCKSPVMKIELTFPRMIPLVRRWSTDFSEDVEICWNAFKASVRSKYGDVSVFRTWECHKDGYPHIHAIIVFHDTSIWMENRKVKAGRKWCVPDELNDDFHRFWGKAVGKKYYDSLVGRGRKGEVVPVVNCAGVTKPEDGVRYIAKYLLKTLDGESWKHKLTLALSWFFGRRMYGLTGRFREWYLSHLDLNVTKCITKTEDEEETKFEPIGMSTKRSLEILNGDDKDPPMNYRFTVDEFREKLNEDYGLILDMVELGISVGKMKEQMKMGNEEWKSEAWEQKLCIVCGEKWIEVTRPEMRIDSRAVFEEGELKGYICVDCADDGQHLDKLQLKIDEC